MSTAVYPAVVTARISVKRSLHGVRGRHEVGARRRRLRAQSAQHGQKRRARCHVAVGVRGELAAGERQRGAAACEARRREVFDEELVARHDDAHARTYRRVAHVAGAREPPSTVRAMLRHAGRAAGLVRRAAREVRRCDEQPQNDRGGAHGAGRLPDSPVAGDLIQHAKSPRPRLTASHVVSGETEAST